MWLVLLWQHRKRLNPPSSFFSDMKSVIAKRNEDKHLSTIAFLFSVYKPNYFWFEPVEMYRRIAFVGILPLMSQSISRRASIGVLFALLSAAFYREVEPFGRSSTNVLVHVAQYSIFLTFASALAIETDLTKGTDSFVVGLILVAANLSILMIALSFGTYRHYLDEERLWKWRRPLTDAEMDLIEQVMLSPAEGTPVPVASKLNLLQQHTLKESDVILEKRVGKGKFGEVFVGICFNEKVAVKTVLEVNEQNMSAFRAEIMLTCTLRHPCIVNFRGCCWGQDLTCLVLEWAAKGSLEGLLLDLDSNLCWNEPLLQLITDVARGVQYLHAREFYDEVDKKQKKSVVHRDLKPANVLITEYDRAKVADFGSSKALSVNGKSVDIAGSPIFAAPEIMLAEPHDEKCDVYSFGMLLIDVATSEGLCEFIAKRWREFRASSNLAETEKQEYDALHALQSVCKEKWRPVTSSDYGLQAPPAICHLIVQCIEHDPLDRPCFDAVVTELLGPCRAQVEAGCYCRSGSGSAGTIEGEYGKASSAKEFGLGASSSLQTCDEGGDEKNSRHGITSQVEMTELADV